MGFDIGNNVNKSLSLEQLTKGLDPTKDKKKIDRITQIFNKYNTNVDERSAQVLDIDEQVSIMSDYHKADKNNDGHITRNSLRKAGFSGEYKAYRDFMEAYQNALGDSKNTFDLNIKDMTVAEKPVSQIKAVQKTQVGGKDLSIEHDYIADENGNKKIKTTFSGEDEMISRNPKGQIIRQKVGDTVLSYHYDNESKNAKPTIINIRSDESYNTAKLQDDGSYFDDKNDSHYRLNNKKLLDEFTVDSNGRITDEFYGDNEYQYTYGYDSAMQPSSITVTNDNTGDAKVYTQEKGVYSVMNGDKKEYYDFDTNTREFSAAEAPKPDKQNKPETKHLVKMTNGWRNQRINKDGELSEQLNVLYSADEVLKKLVENNERFKEANLNDKSLLADLIHNNPSMFDKDGNVYADAKWEKLDFPTDLSKYLQA